MYARTPERSARISSGGRISAVMGPADKMHAVISFGPLSLPDRFFVQATSEP